MKRLISWLVPVGLCCLTVLPRSVKAAEFCVSTSFDLVSALSTAIDNGEDDVIKVQKGTYTPYSVGPNIYDFYYYSNEGRSFTILGGWTVGCAAREVDPSNTILDGNSNGRVLTLIHYGGGDITVDGFTVKNGLISGNAQGAGIFVLSSDPNQAGNVIISNNAVEGNSTDYEGGGIYAHSESNPQGKAGTVTVTHNTVKNNQATGASYASGGGIDAWSYSFQGTSSHISIQENIVQANISDNGGGIYAWSYGPSGAGQVVVKNNLVTENSATAGWGGGIYAGSHGVTGDSGMVQVTGNTVIGNSATGGLDKGKGGGIYAYTACAQTGNSKDVVIKGNKIRKNKAKFGGGIFVETSSGSGTGGDAIFEDNAISGNWSENSGGGLVCFPTSTSGTAGKMVMVNNIITGNDAGVYGNGGGIWVRSYTVTGGVPGTVILTNNTITGNRANVGGGVYLILEGNTFNLYNNIIWMNPFSVLSWDIITSQTGVLNGYNNNYGNFLGQWSSSQDNIQQNPLFVNNGEWNENGTPNDPSDDVWIEGDYHLQFGSPCVNQGTNSAAEIPSTDKDGNPRIVGGSVDMGAYEYDDCVPVSPELSLNIPCATYFGSQYTFALIFYPNPADPNNLYWKMDLGTFGTANTAGPCVNVTSGLTLQITCAQLAGLKYAFDLQYYSNPADPSNLYWRMDLNSVVSK